MTNYQALANAVILTAVEDYRDKLRGIHKSYAIDGKPFLEKFFRSRWFTTLSNADGVWIMKQLKKEYREEKRREKYD